jgi:hypothetical protein
MPPVLIGRFDLAIQLGDLQAAGGIALELDAEPKWRQLVCVCVCVLFVHACMCISILYDALAEQAL